ncbi:unnamed protein product [Trichogramma brassicae]|uniref:Uncharacterized protein n=1 Tax=Trichogramma brassicae TaxID=86971 RepID=A0A6H5J8X3_9HYME|nr:unnamed protein product [Trichogramma brassicae]
MKLGAVVHDVALFHSSALCIYCCQCIAVRLLRYVLYAVPRGLRSCEYTHKSCHRTHVRSAIHTFANLCMLHKQVGPAHYQCLTSLIRAAYNTRTWQMRLSIRQYRDIMCCFVLRI